VTFNDPRVLSPFQEKDKLVFHIKKKNDLFISAATKHDLSTDYTTLSANIPRQLVFEPAT
jgi:hypothetical protein